mmetsp:Transcript_91519/g.158650  ORF Transcript_91519/g.158650 Transcript_91519/m.158650 type:complete len:174 (-) Transcript_91519:459-980(-)
MLTGGGGQPATEAAPAPAEEVAVAAEDAFGDDFAAAPAAEEFVPEAAPLEAPVEEAPAEPAEPTPLEKWQAESTAAIAKRDAEAAEKADKMKEDAKVTIEQFYAERAEAVAGNHERNVGAEEEFCKQRDSLFSNGEVWERVVSLIDLKGTNEKKQSRVSRMRSLFLHMKNEAK